MQSGDWSIRCCCSSNTKMQEDRCFNCFVNKTKTKNKKDSGVPKVQETKSPVCAPRISVADLVPSGPIRSVPL